MSLIVKRMPLISGIKEHTRKIMTDNLKLKPCPFCGSEHVYLSNWTDQAYVACLDCGCKTDVFLHAHCTERAAQTWNRRAERNAKVTEKTEKVFGIEAEYGGKCTCGAWVYDEQPYCQQCGARLEWNEDGRKDPADRDLADQSGYVVSGQ